VVDILINATSLGILWSVLAIGVYATYRILDIADLSCEGVFPLGAAIAARIISGGGDPLLACLAAIAGGAIAGSITGLLHTKLKIPILLSGILSMTALYSVNLRVLGKANISLLRIDTIFTKFERALGVSSKVSSFGVGLFFVILIILILWWFLNTEIGYSMRATGNNVYMIRAMGVDTDSMFMFGLIIGNALISLAGAIIAQKQSYADIGMGTGTIVIGLASVIIGEVLFGAKNVQRHMVSIVLGSIAYRIIISLILEIDFKIKLGETVIPVSVEPTDLKLFTAIIVVIALSLPLIKQKSDSKKAATMAKS
jgi:putative ABC transport system permease protein